jgi:hypothetical protein
MAATSPLTSTTSAQASRSGVFPSGPISESVRNDVTKASEMIQHYLFRLFVNTVTL